MFPLSASLPDELLEFVQPYSLAQSLGGGSLGRGYEPDIAGPVVCTPVVPLSMSALLAGALPASNS